tara:strand:- start:55 stop:360 length:306 start_codon:yes stop_codon:yes gene_type:complete
MKLKLNLEKINMEKKFDYIKGGKGYDKVVNRKLVLIDDDYNTFDHVIDCLISLCDHEKIQAEQCALLTHHKGFCEILSGKSTDLEFIKKDLLIYGLNVKIV